MLDTKKLRDNPQVIADCLNKKQYNLDLSQYNNLEQERKKIQSQTQELQAKRNKQSKAIGQAKAKGEPIEDLLATVESLGDNLQASNNSLNITQEKLKKYLLNIPNLPHTSVPIGSSEAENIEVKKIGEIPKFDFQPKTHYELAEVLDKGMDFESASVLSGARFVVLRGKIARLHRALIQFMLDLHTEQHGYKEIYVPYLVKSKVLYGTGQFPKLEHDQYGTKDDDLWLIPTAEAPLANLHRDKILAIKDLPIKYVAHSTCFRREAGTYGKDMHGMLRQHQFDKVELIQIVHPENSYAALENLTQNAEQVLKLLNLPYRVVELCTGDLGFAASKTYDLEVWLPGQNAYREISSCSNTEDFQARRMQTRWRNTETKKPELVHILNGSGLAVGRTLIAVLENFQDANGHVQVPKVLQSYMGGCEVIAHNN